MLSIDKDAVLAEGTHHQGADHAGAASRLASAAEQRGDVVSAAGELFVLLDALLDVPGTYKEDVQSVDPSAQEMLRLYVPGAFVQAASGDRQEGGREEALPDYNPFGDDWKTKLASIDTTLIVRAVAKTRQHVDQKPVNVLLTGGLDAIKTMVTTKDLQEGFKDKSGKPMSRLGDQKSRDAMLAYFWTRKSATCRGTRIDPAAASSIRSRSRNWCSA